MLHVHVVVACACNFPSIETGHSDTGINITLIALCISTRVCSVVHVMFNRHTHCSLHIHTHIIDAHVHAHIYTHINKQVEANENIAVCHFGESIA